MGNEVKDVNPKEKMWLVRSSSRLIGPYNLEEIVELLTYNQVSFVDEIRRPKSRWNFIRDYPYLTETVKNNRDKLNLSNSKNSALSLITGSFTKTGTGAETQAPQEPIKINFDDIKDIEPLKEVPFSFNPKIKVADQKQAAAVAKSYGLLNDQKVKDELRAEQEKLRRNIIIVAVVAVIGFAGFKIFQRMRDSEKNRVRIEKITQYYNLKMYQKSFQTYKDVASIADVPKETQDLIAPARITIGKEIGELRGQLMTAAEVAPAKKRAELYNLVGLSYQIEGDNLKAQESFKKALVQDPINEQANINWGVQNYKVNAKLILSSNSKQTLTENYKAFTSVRYENYENSNYFNFIRGLYLLDFNELFKEDSNLVKKDLFEAGSKSAFLRSENALIQIGLNRVDNAATDSSFIDFIELIPQQSKNFARNPSLDWSLADWTNLDEVCERIYDKSQMLLPKLFRAFCALESGQFEVVDKMLDEAHLLSVGSNHYDLMQLHVAYAKGSKIQLESLLKKADLATFAATHYYRGQNCLANRKLDCAKEAFSTLGEKFPEWGYLAALGLFQVDRTVYSRNIFEALKKEPLQLQLIEARATLENQE